MFANTPIGQKSFNDIVNVITLIDRPLLTELAQGIVERKMTVEEIEHLEVQIEAVIEQMAKDLDYLDREWIETAITQDEIPV